MELSLKIAEATCVAQEQPRPARKMHVAHHGDLASGGRRAADSDEDGTRIERVHVRVTTARERF